MRESQRGCRDHASLREKNDRTTAADATAGHDAHAGLLDELLARVAPCSARRVIVMSLNRILR